MTLDQHVVGQFAQLLGQTSQSAEPLAVGTGLPDSKNMPASVSSSSIRSPSDVTVISTWSFRLLKFGHRLERLLDFLGKLDMSSFGTSRALPNPPLQSRSYCPARWGC